MFNRKQFSEDLFMYESNQINDEGKSYKTLAASSSCGGLTLTTYDTFYLLNDLKFVNP